MKSLKSLLDAVCISWAELVSIAKIDIYVLWNFMLLNCLSLYEGDEQWGHTGHHVLIILRSVTMHMCLKFSLDCTSLVEELMFCGSSVTNLTSGQPVNDNAVLLWVCVQILPALLPNTESSCRVFISSPFFIVYLTPNVKHYVSTHCPSVFPESIYIYCTVYPKVYAAKSQWCSSSFVCKCFWPHPFHSFFTCLKRTHIGIHPHFVFVLFFSKQLHKRHPHVALPHSNSSGALLESLKRPK